jgi:hypothetical protein
MKWLARLKKTELFAKAEATKPTEPGFVGFVAPISARMPKEGADSPAANDPTSGPNRWSWPHSEAMNGAEIEAFTARLARFSDKGLSLGDGEALADKLVKRDRETDDRRLCLECSHLAGSAAFAWRCGSWQLAGVALKARDAAVPIALVQTLQRCNGFASAIEK